MRKKVILSTIILLVMLSLLLTACGEPKFGVLLMVDGVLYEEVMTKGKETIEIPESPTKEGYTFDGWYVDENTWQEEIIADYFAEDKLKDNLTAYAKWTINQYTITFNSNEGSEVSAITGDYSSEISAPSRPTKTGHTFRGWYSDEALQNTYTFSTMPAENITVYAKWSINQYTIRFDSNDGSEVSAITQKYASEVTAPANPTKETFAFVGWYIDEALQNAYTFSTMQAANITLYAKWTIGQYTLSFNSNDGSAVSPITQYYGSEVAAPIEPTKEGVTFCGWFSDEALQNKYAFSTMPSKDTTLYALWKAPTAGLVYTLINDDAEYQVSKGTASESNIVIPRFYNGKMVTSIGNDGFKDYSTLTNIEIPSSLTSIGSYAFYECANLASIIIPNSVTSIGAHAFHGCTRLINIEIPNGVTSIENATFTYCTNLTSIEIPSSVTSIGNQAFYACYNLNDIEIPSGMTNIGNGAFQYCFILTSIEIPSGVNRIEPNTFSGCSGLTSITISNGVISIGDHAFANCDDLTSIEIPSSVTSIEERIFHGCMGLIEINVDEENQIYSSIESNLYDKDGTTLIKYAIGKTTTSYTTPNSVTIIGSEAFAYCENITSIIITSGVESIEYGAFRGCDALASIEISNSVTSIGKSAFEWCTNLATITIPSSVTSIGENALYDCTSLSEINVAEQNPIYSSIDSNLYNKNGTTLIQYAIGKTAPSFTIPSSVTSIGKNAFSLCEYLISIEIPSSITNIDTFAFAHCSSLTSIEIPNSVTAIGSWSFYDCGSLTSITIPDSVTSFGEWAFASCANLTTIIIPSNVTSIGSYAFYNCSSLITITLPESVTNMGENVFYGCTNITIKVEVASKPEGWSASWNPDNYTVIWNYSE